jgi:hypothetical protein
MPPGTATTPGVGSTTLAAEPTLRPPRGATVAPPPDRATASPSPWTKPSAAGRTSANPQAERLRDDITRTRNDLDRYQFEALRRQLDKTLGLRGPDRGIGLGL